MAIHEHTTDPLQPRFLELDEIPPERYPDDEDEMTEANDEEFDDDVDDDDDLDEGENEEEDLENE